MLIRFLLATAMGAMLVQPVVAAAEDKAAQQRTEIRKMRDATLADLYRQKPELKAKVEKASGYAVFSNVGVQVIFFGGGGGHGVAVDNKTGKEVFMSMAQVSAGIGVGVKDFRGVFLFHDETTLNRFIYSGWEFGGEAGAAAKSDSKGGSATDAASMTTGIEVYQLTKSGVIASATVAGTKYWLDKRLNP